jgi:hypothetical protein
VRVSRWKAAWRPQRSGPPVPRSGSDRQMPVEIRRNAGKTRKIRRIAESGDGSPDKIPVDRKAGGV